MNGILRALSSFAAIWVDLGDRIWIIWMSGSVPSERLSRRLLRPSMAHSSYRHRQRCSRDCGAEPDLQSPCSQHSSLLILRNVARCHSKNKAPLQFHCLCKRQNASGQELAEEGPEVALPLLDEGACLPCPRPQTREQSHLRLPFNFTTGAHVCRQWVVHVSFIQPSRSHTLLKKLAPAKGCAHISASSIVTASKMKSTNFGDIYQRRAANGLAVSGLESSLGTVNPCLISHLRFRGTLFLSAITANSRGATSSMTTALLVSTCYTVFS